MRFVEEKVKVSKGRDRERETEERKYREVRENYVVDGEQVKGFREVGWERGRGGR